MFFSCLFFFLFLKDLLNQALLDDTRLTAISHSGMVYLKKGSLTLCKLLYMSHIKIQLFWSGVSKISKQNVVLFLERVLAEVKCHM